MSFQVIPIEAVAELEGSNQLLQLQSAHRGMLHHVWAISSDHKV